MTSAISALPNHILIYLLTNASNPIYTSGYNSSTYNNAQKKAFFYTIKYAEREKNLALICEFEH